MTAEDVEHSHGQRALLELARLDHRDPDKVFRATTEVTSLMLDVDRAGIWTFSDDSRSLACEDLFRRRVGHTHGDILCADEFPRYFETLAGSTAIAADDAQCDPRTAELRDSYLRHHGVVSMLEVPIRCDGRVVGVLCSEQVGARRHWGPDDEALAACLADVAARAMEATARDLVEQRLREILNAIPEGVYFVDHEGTFTAVNGAAAQVLERIGAHKLDEAANRFEMLDIESNVIPRERWPASRALRGETVSGEVVGFRYPPDEELAFSRVSASPVYVRGRVHSAVAIAADISHEMHLEYLKRDLLSTLAHELKTPAAIAKGYAQYLARDVELGPKCAPMLDAIERAANRIDQLVSVMLTAGSIMLGRLVLTQRRFDLVEQLRVSIARLAPRATHHSIVFTGPDVLFVRGDVAHIEQAVEQLIDNAIRFSPRGGEVNVTLEVVGANVLVSVRDRGVGIPIAERARVFSAYHRRERARQRRVDGGLGIGLFVSREIVRAHGGELWFESVEGEGTTFHARLPIGEIQQ